MCEKCIIRLKYLINTVYAVLAILTIEVVGNQTFLNQAFVIENGDMFDLMLNWGSAILVYVIAICIVVYLAINAYKFKLKVNDKFSKIEGTKVIIESKAKSGQSRWCSVFNPLC